MGKALGWTLTTLLVLVAAGFGGRLYANRLMSSRAVTPKSLGDATPTAAGLPFSRVAVQSGDRTLMGWWVRATADSSDSGKVAPAVLFLHGNRSSISDLIPLQKHFHRQGISSWVFDYSGFGASGGDPSLRNAIADAGAVARAFADSAGRGTRKVAMGSALGATVLLQAIDSVQPHVDGVVIEGTPASVKESAVRDGRIPRILAPMLADVADNVTAARRVHVPLLAVHSHADNRFPFSDAERVVAAVPGQASLVRHWRKGHAALLNSSKPCDWAPVLAFVRTGALPPGKIDTTDACAAEQRAARADSIAAEQRRALEAATRARMDSIAAARRAATKAPPRTKAAPTKTKTPSTKTKTPSTKTKTAPTKTKSPPARTKVPS